MNIKLFFGHPDRTEREVNAWLEKNSRYKIEKISMSCAMYVNPHSGDGEPAVSVMIEHIRR